MESPIYAGSRLFLPLSQSVGVPLDQLNFVICLFSGVAFGLFLRLALSHTTVSPKWRYLYCLVVGMSMLYFMIGWEIWQVLLQVFVSYVLIKFLPSRHMPVTVFCYALGHMLFLYILRLFKPFDQLCYDPTYPLMMTTQKITTLAFSLGDWRLMQKKGAKVQEERQKWAVRDLPNIMEYLAFLTSFQGILAGPFCHFNMFRSFIYGYDPRKKEDAPVIVEYMDHPGSFWKAFVTKLIAVFFWLSLNVVLKPQFPDHINVDPEYIASTNIIFRMWYLYFSLFLDRSKYYLTWILADVVYNASGLGYSGKDKNGQHTWTAMSNVNVLKIETSTSLKIYLDNWNILTTNWLRHVCYMRVPFLKIYMTFILSALWHGLFVGYYITFLSATICVEAGRKIRTNIRPFFQGSKFSRIIYEIITFIGTQLTVSVLVISFVVLDWEPIKVFHNSIYWSLHLSALAICLGLPSGKKSTSKSKEEKPVNSVNGIEKVHGSNDVSKKDR